MPKNRKIIIVIILLFMRINLAANIDTARINRMLKTIDLQGIFNREASLGLAQKAYLLAQKTGYIEGEIKAYLKMGHIEYYYSGKNDVALNYFFKALQLSEQIENLDLLAESCVRISSIYFKEELNSECFLYLAKAQNYIRNTKNNALKSLILGRLGRYYFLMAKNNTISLKYYLQAYELIKDNKKNESFGWIMLALGDYYLRTQNTLVAKKYFENCIIIFKEQNEFVLLSYTYSELAKLKYDLKQYQAAINYAKQGLEYATTYKLLKEQIDNSELLYIAYKKTADLKNALLYREKIDSIKQLTSSTAIAGRIFNAKTKVDLEKKDNIIDLINEENELFKNQKILYKLMLALVGLILIGLGFFVKSKILSNKVLSEKNLIINKQRDEVSNKNKEIIDSITYAKRIQEALLPSKVQLAAIFKDNFFIFLKPRDIVCGDFFWISEIGHLRFFAVADCTGHGVPGSMMSVLGNSLLNELVNEKNILVPNKILTKLKERIIKDLKQGSLLSSSRDGMDIAICCLNINTLVLTYAGANNPIYYYKNQTKQLNKLLPNKMPIGFSYNIDSDFTQETVQLDKGDHVYLFSDGYTDQFGGEKEKKFRHKRFENLLLSNAQLSIKEQGEIVANTFTKWKGDVEQVDDVIVLGITI